MPPLTVSSRSVTSTSRRSATRPRVLATQARAAHATGALQCSLMPGARSPSPHCRRAAVHTAGGASVVARFTTCLRTCTPHSLSPYRTVPYQVYSTSISPVAAYGVEQCGLAPPHGSHFHTMALVLVCIIGARSLRLKLAWAISRPPTTQARLSVLSWRRPLWVQLRFFFLQMPLETCQRSYVKRQCRFR